MSDGPILSAQGCLLGDGVSAWRVSAQAGVVCLHGGCLPRSVCVCTGVSAWGVSGGVYSGGCTPPCPLLAGIHSLPVDRMTETFVKT